MHLLTRNSGVLFGWKNYHVKFATILQIIYQCEKLAYFNNHIAITFNLANKAKKIN
jgi:hypothetical protein